MKMGTFYFRLNAHQATIVAAVNQIISSVTWILILLLFRVLLQGFQPGPQIKIHRQDHEREMYISEIREFHMNNQSFRIDWSTVVFLDIWLTALILGSLLNLCFKAGALFAVLNRQRCLMLPWLVIEGMNLMSYVIMYFYFLGATLAFAPTFGITFIAFILYTAIVITVIGPAGYNWMAGIASFAEIGVDKQIVMIRNAAIAAQYQSSIHDLNRGGLV